MIFKQVDEILSGRKTQTRRVCKPNEQVIDPANFVTVFCGSRVKWQVGRTYAVVRRRGQPALWWTEVQGGRIWESPAEFGPDWFESNGWHRFRIRILKIYKEPLLNITVSDARAEGVRSIAEYIELWQRINGKTKGARWQDNPDVWVITFEMVRNP